MITALLLLAALAALYGWYRLRCAWAPFTTKGRRRVLYWGRGWWSGQNAENRDDY